MHVITVDEVCPNCKFHNMIKTKTKEFVEIVACGRCGTLLHFPETLTKLEKEMASKVAKRESTNVIL